MRTREGLFGKQVGLRLLSPMYLAICRFQMKHEAQEQQRILQFHMMLWRSGYRRGDSTCLVRRCSSSSFLCLKRLFSVRSMLLFFVEVRRRCCTGCCTSKRCIAVFADFGKEHYPCQPNPCVIA